ncbi:MAG: LamG domain-containing protein, partial [Planctomycetes bacterium]|nr:LamG domain-containing protein [Planctomycetota bacterium]
AATFEPTGPEADGVISGRVALYVDGQRVAEGTHHGWLTELDWPARIGAAEYVPHSLTSWLFRGFLSDIALYNYPLSEEAIQRHFQVGLASTTAAHIESTNTPLVMYEPDSFQSRQLRTAVDSEGRRTGDHSLRITDHEETVNVEIDSHGSAVAMGDIVMEEETQLRF